MAGTFSLFESQNLTANGDTAGIGCVSVADATGFTVGATVSLYGTTVAAGEYEVAFVDLTNNVIKVRAAPFMVPHLPAINYGLTSVAQYTTADSAVIVQNVQFIYS